MVFGVPGWCGGDATEKRKPLSTAMKIEAFHTNMPRGAVWASRDTTP